jgi:hypothetical protein
MTKLSTYIGHMIQIIAKDTCSIDTSAVWGKPLSIGGSQAWTLIAYTFILNQVPIQSLMLVHIHDVPAPSF